MIHEKPLQKKASRYAGAVVSTLKSKTRPPWDSVQGLVEAAYFNGFQSGIVWQNGQTTRYKVIDAAGKTLMTNIDSEASANRYRARFCRNTGRSHHVIPYAAEYRTRVRVAQKAD